MTSTVGLLLRFYKCKFRIRYPWINIIDGKILNLQISDVTYFPEHIYVDLERNGFLWISLLVFIMCLWNMLELLAHGSGLIIVVLVCTSNSGSFLLEHGIVWKSSHEWCVAQSDFYWNENVVIQKLHFDQSEHCLAILWADIKRLEWYNISTTKSPWPILPSKRWIHIASIS